MNKNSVYRCDAVYGVFLYQSFFVKENEKSIAEEEIKQLKAWFQAYELRFNEIRLSNYEYIFDLRKFIEVQVNSVKRNWSNPTFEPDIRSLYRLKKVLEENDSPDNEY